MNRAQRAGDTDGALNALSRPDDFDPRGRFNLRTDLPEADWREYERAFAAGFKRTCETFRIGGGR